jgi:uncharacterized protein
MHAGGETSPAGLVEELVQLPGEGGQPGHTLRFVRFGQRGARPKVYLQAGLHADELPGMLVLRKLTEALTDRAAGGEIIGEIVLAPIANPIGLAQQRADMVIGRAELASGRNFNRGFPDLAAEIIAPLRGKLSADAAANVETVRAAMRAALAKRTPADAFETMQLCLMADAIDADIVLDLHADNEAQLHLYTLPQHWPAAEDLAAELDARAVLLCEVSGGEPFDEACSGPWIKLAKAFPEAALPPACFAASVELRSNNDVDPRWAEQDARALMRFLIRRGAVAGEAGGLPRLLCQATPLTAMQQLKAPIEGLVIYRARLGDQVRVGDVIAEIIPAIGPPAPVTAATEGLLFARHNQPYAWPGKIIGKIAGVLPLPDRVGDLLSP